MIVASCAEHGMPSASSRIAISRSFGVAENPRRHRRHRVAAEAEDHRQHRLAVQPHHAEDAIAEDREPRDVAAVLEEAEHQEEGGDHRQHDRDRVGERPS